MCPNKSFQAFEAHVALHITRKHKYTSFTHILQEVSNSHLTIRCAKAHSCYSKEAHASYLLNMYNNGFSFTRTSQLI